MKQHVRHLALDLPNGSLLTNWEYFMYISFNTFECNYYHNNQMLNLLALRTVYWNRYNISVILKINLSLILIIYPTGG